MQSHSRTDVFTILPEKITWTQKDKIILSQAWDNFVFPEDSEESDETIVENFCKTLEKTTSLNQPWKSIKLQLDLLLDQQDQQT